MTNRVRTLFLSLTAALLLSAVTVGGVAAQDPVPDQDPEELAQQLSAGPLAQANGLVDVSEEIVGLLDDIVAVEPPPECIGGAPVLFAIGWVCVPFEDFTDI